MLVDQIQITENGLVIEVVATSPTSCCPLCSQLGAVDIAHRRQESDLLDPTSLHEEGRPLPQGTHRGRQIPGGHRSVLPAGGRGRGEQVRRNGAEDRERRPDDQRRPSSMRAIVRDTYDSPDVLELPHQALGFARRRCTESHSRRISSLGGSWLH
jgi:hypothetical protein